VQVLYKQRVVPLSKSCQTVPSMEDLFLKDEKGSIVEPAQVGCLLEVLNTINARDVQIAMQRGRAVQLFRTKMAK